jgi:hypothetical protein
MPRIMCTSARLSYGFVTLQQICCAEFRAGQFDDAGEQPRILVAETWCEQIAQALDNDAKEGASVFLAKRVPQKLV